MNAKCEFFGLVARISTLNFSAKGDAACVSAQPQCRNGTVRQNVPGSYSEENSRKNKSSRSSVSAVAFSPWSAMEAAFPSSPQTRISGGLARGCRAARTVHDRGTGRRRLWDGAAFGGAGSCLPSTAQKGLPRGPTTRVACKPLTAV